MSTEQLSYMCSVRAAFPVVGTEEERYLTSFRALVNEFIEDNKDCTKDCLIENFGTPQQVVLGYYDMGADVSKHIKKSSRNIKLITVAIVITILILICLLVIVNVNSALTYSEIDVHTLPNVTVYSS
ncbi:MAG: DUF6120 family protein [Lachnospiraceae bacterium]